VVALEHRLPAVMEPDLSRLINAVSAMVATAAVVPSAERFAVARRQIDVGRKERVRQIVRKLLRTPTFGPIALCRLVGMSRSSLYRLYEDGGGVARYIQRERLLEAHAVVTDPTTTKSVSAIAEDFCFADASSFTCASKREFGHRLGRSDRRRTPGWCHLCRREALLRRREETLASSFADSSCAKPLANNSNSAEWGDVPEVRGRR
jgi:AraC-like DNA-binding protein